MAHPTDPARLVRPAKAALHTEAVVPAEAALELLIARGASEVDHPGGTLLTHLMRVYELLSQWEARPEVRLAGLCHAFYGTDGFPQALGAVTRREELASVIGSEAERLVYFYASCEREFSYPRLAEGLFMDRFSGEVLRPSLPLCQDFAELTVANELDVVRTNPDIKAKYGPELLALFTSWQSLISLPAQASVRMALP